jgi:DNA-binding CsgD family transcriptional regulator
VTAARLRCALSVVLSAGGQDERARAEAAAALAQPGLPAGLRDDAIAARLQALAGPADREARQLAAGVLAQRSQHGSQTVTAALVIRALTDWDQGQAGSALDGLSEAARQGRAVSADARHVQPLLALAASLADLGRYGEAQKVIQAIDPAPLQGIPAHVVLAILKARLSLARGDVGQAASAANAAVAAAGPARGYASLGHGLLALIALRQGDLAAAAHHLSSEPGPVPYLAASYARSAACMSHAQVAAASAGPAAAISHIRGICADLPHRPGILLGQPGIPAWLVRTALAAGEPGLATDVGRAAGALAAANPDVPAVTGAAAHSLGLLNHDAAQLADAAAQHGDLWAQASAAEDLGVLLAAQASKDQAIAQLTVALERYGRSGASMDMARIRRRLRRLGVRRRHWTLSADRPVTGWESLTEAERATSQLAAQGLNNTQIGSRLYISKHTVAFHLRQIFRKLQIGSRVELTRIVVELGRL